MRNSGRGRHVRDGRRGVDETARTKRVDEPVDRIAMHGTGVDRARWYHSGQRYSPRLYLVRGGRRDGGRGDGRARVTRNGASSVLRHNWNSMTRWTKAAARLSALWTASRLTRIHSADIFDLALRSPYLRERHFGSEASKSEGRCRYTSRSSIERLLASAGTSRLYQSSFNINAT